MDTMLPERTVYFKSLLFRVLRQWRLLLLLMLAGGLLLGGGRVDAQALKTAYETGEAGPAPQARTDCAARAAASRSSRQ